MQPETRSRATPSRTSGCARAVAHAINVDALIDRVLRGNGVPAGIVSIPGLNGYDAELDRRPAFDLARARSLMSEAGWGDGFRIGFLCPNNRYVNDTEVCRAIAGQLAQINIKAEVDSVPRNVYFSRLLEIDTSFYIIGLTASAYDTFDLLQSNLMTREPPDGQVNFGRWSNADYDAAVNALKSEIDPAKRRALYRARDHPGPRRPRRPASLSPGHQLGDEIQRRRDPSLRQLRPPEVDHG